MSTKVEVLVIGGGPAGSSCALTLAKFGIDVIIVDKRKFPRSKLCGGLLSERSRAVFLKIFDRDLDERLFITGSDIMFLQKGKKLAMAPPDSPKMYFTMRKDFDLHLLNLARRQGAKTMLGHKIRKLDIQAKTALLDDGTSIEYTFLVGADGVNSQVAKTLYGHSFNPKTVGFCLEVEVPRRDLPNQSNSPEIDFGVANWGYGWVFPKRETFTIGVGGLNGKNENMRANLAKLFARKRLDLSAYKVKGHFIPFRDFRSRPAKKSVLLCGDAAGFVDPITGEGIAYAMDSGYRAALAIRQAKDLGAADANKLYFAQIKPIISALRHAMFFRNFIFPKGAEKSFAKFFPGGILLQKGYLDILAGKHGYGYLYYLFPAQIIAVGKIRFHAILGKLGLVKN